jgi:hypothetical protein
MPQCASHACRGAGVSRHPDGPQVCGRIVAQYRATEIEMRPGAICVDVIGEGASVYDALRNTWSGFRT